MEPASVALADPHRDVGGFQGLVHGTGQVIADRVQVHGVLQPGGERGHGLVGVISGPVEPPVHRPLHPPPQRIEQCRRGQRRRRPPPPACGIDTTRVASSTSPAYDPTSRPVTIAYASVREMIRSMSNRRYLRTATPMLSGTARTSSRRRRPRRRAARAGESRAGESRAGEYGHDAGEGDSRSGSSATSAAGGVPRTSAGS